MVNLSTIRHVITSAIEKHTEKPVIRTNQDATPPEYPFISYTITTLMRANNGTYGLFIEDDENGASKKYYRKEFQQVWSFTACAADDITSKELALQLYDFLDKIGKIELAENGVVIQRIENITNRDSLLTNGYEYRNGFDVFFAFMNEIEEENTDEIDDVQLNYNSNSE
jgi:hypothetical protein